jgi:hypothetical protein
VERRNQAVQRCGAGQRRLQRQRRALALYAGSYGKLTDPTGELAAFWQAADPFTMFTQHNLPAASQVIDDEPTGPLEGYLQCSESLVTCAWADYSGIIVVSQAQPSEFNWLAQFTTGPAGIYSEQTLAGLTKSFRSAAELLRHTRTRSAQASAAGRLSAARQESLATGTPRRHLSPSAGAEDGEH